MAQKVIKYNPFLLSSVIKAVIESFLHEDVKFDSTGKEKQAKVLDLFRKTILTLKHRYQKRIIASKNKNEKTELTREFNSLPDFLKIDHTPYGFFLMNNSDIRFNKYNVAGKRLLLKKLAHYEFDLNKEPDFAKVISIISINNTSQVAEMAKSEVFDYVDEAVEEEVAPTTTTAAPIPVVKPIVKKVTAKKKPIAKKKTPPVKK